MNILYPHYLSPIPSMSIVKFDPGKKQIPASGYRIEKNTILYSKPVFGSPCQFITCYPITLWPLEVVSANLRDPKLPVKNGQQAIVIRLKTTGPLKFSELPLEKLRFFINGPGQHVYHIYELLFNHACHIECESANKKGSIESISLDRDPIETGGSTRTRT